MMVGGENVMRRQTLRTLRILWKRRTSCRVCTSFVHTNIMKTNGAQTSPAHPTKNDCLGRFALSLAHKKSPTPGGVRDLVLLW